MDDYEVLEVRCDEVQVGDLVGGGGTFPVTGVEVGSSRTTITFANRRPTRPLNGRLVRVHRPTAGRTA